MQAITGNESDRDGSVDSDFGNAVVSQLQSGIRATPTGGRKVGSTRRAAGAIFPRWFGKGKKEWEFSQRCCARHVCACILVVKNQ